jgi:hypothetical protein
MSAKKAVPSPSASASVNTATTPLAGDRLIVRLNDARTMTMTRTSQQRECQY